MAPDKYVRRKDMRSAGQYLLMIIRNELSAYPT